MHLAVGLDPARQLFERRGAVDAIQVRSRGMATAVIADPFDVEQLGVGGGRGWVVWPQDVRSMRFAATAERDSIAAMGVGLVSVDNDEWRREREEHGSIAARVETRLGASLTLGTEPFRFEEKLYRYMGGFNVLAREEIGTYEDDETPRFVGNLAEVFVPVPFDGVIHIGGDGIYADELVIASSHALLQEAQKLAAAVALREDIPRGNNLEIGRWFDENDDDNVAFYVALFLRAAEHSVTYHVALTLT